MTECCGPAQPCCGSTPPEYDYGPAPFLDGEVDTFAGSVPRLSTALSAEDRRGTVRVRLGIGRSDYRVKPQLYAIGQPDDTSPVLVTGNYKLTIDTVRMALAGLDVWLLVIDSRGVNVWCAAGKGTFGTAEVVRAVRDARLEQIVSHTRLVLPQLGATGVAAHEVRRQSGFSAVWGPVRIGDVPAFLEAGMKATPEMRRVEFPLAERAKLVSVELSVLWRPWVLAWLGGLLALAVALAWFAPALAVPVALLVGTLALAVVAGAVVMPLMLPVLPGRSFALKGATAGVLVLGLAAAALGAAGQMPVWGWGLVVGGAALASFVAMNFTGSSTFTSPSGVEWEMRRAIPAQLVGAVAGAGLFVAGIAMGVL